LRLKEKAEIAQLYGIIAVMGGDECVAAGLPSSKPFEDLTGAVGGAVVYDEDFLANGGFDDAAEDFVDCGFFVVDGDDHGELGVMQSGRIAARGHAEEDCSGVCVGSKASYLRAMMVRR